MTSHNHHDMFLSPDEDGRWSLSHNYTLRFEEDTTTGECIAVVRGKHGDIATIPADELDHLHKVFYSAACVHERIEENIKPVTVDNTHRPYLFSPEATPVSRLVPEPSPTTPRTLTTEAELLLAPLGTIIRGPETWEFYPYTKSGTDEWVGSNESQMFTGKAEEMAGREWTVLYMPERGDVS